MRSSLSAIGQSPFREGLRRQGRLGAFGRRHRKRHRHCKGADAGKCRRVEDFRRRTICRMGGRSRKLLHLIPHPDPRRHLLRKWSPPRRGRADDLRLVLRSRQISGRHLKRNRSRLDRRPKPASLQCCLRQNSRFMAPRPTRKVAGLVDLSEAIVRFGRPWAALLASVDLSALYFRSGNDQCRHSTSRRSTRRASPASRARISSATNSSHKPASSAPSLTQDGSTQRSPNQSRNPSGRRLQ